MTVSTYLSSDYYSIQCNLSVTQDNVLKFILWVLQRVCGLGHPTGTSQSSSYNVLLTMPSMKSLSLECYLNSLSSFQGSSMIYFVSHIMSIRIHSWHIYFHSLLIKFPVICLNIWLTPELQSQIFYSLLSISLCFLPSQHMTKNDAWSLPLPLSYLHTS